MTTYSEAVEQTITAGEQIHQIVNGTATTEVTVEDGSKVPSIRKALLDNFYFKDPIAWQVGQTENVFNQLRQFTDGSWWYAPSATASNPISMWSTPVGDALWKIYDFDAIGKLTPQLREALRRSYAGAGYNLADGSFEAGGTVTNASDVLLYEAEGKAYSYTGGTFPHTVVAGSNPSAEQGMWTSISAIYLRTIVSPLVIASFKKAGFNVVGSFEVGASTSDKNDAVIKYSTGKAYVRTDGLPFTVISGSTPSTGWTEVTDSVTLSSSVISRTDVSSQADSFFNKTYSPVKIVAHRGFSFIAMENTIWAFQKAKNLGADMLECDIQVSSDGIPLIFHDDTTDRLMSGTGDVLSMTYAAMAAMTFTSLAGTAYKNEVIPRFVDMCYWLRSNDIQVLAEFKRLRSIADVQLIINIAKQYEVLDKFVWQCNDTTILVEARKYAPKNKIAFFSDTFIQSRLDELSLMGNAIYMVQYAALNADNTIGGKCHAAGVELATYTNNNSYTLRRLRRNGLQYIITDVNLGRLS